MGWLDWAASIALVLAALPFGLTLFNLLLYRAPADLETKSPEADSAGSEGPPDVSILIPARDEETVIEKAVRTALASRRVRVEVLVMDDQSSDRTPEIVREIAAGDARVRLFEAPPLPDGWAGKQHACQALADRARGALMIFVDADVELAPSAAARIRDFMGRGEAPGLALASGFPHQVTGTLGEKLIIPLIHFVLLGYLPLIGMRLSNSAGFAAGCGQLMAARRDAYRQAGGHASIRWSFHDGIQLPRSFRRAGLRTDLFDATRLASCRMYEDARGVVLGLAKNAHEGMAGPIAIWVWSLLLLGGAVLPLFTAALSLTDPASLAFRASLAAVVLGWLTRLALALRFRQSLLSALLHPVGIAGLVWIQWYSRWRRITGQGVTWKDRGVVES